MSPLEMEGESGFGIRQKNLEFFKHFEIRQKMPISKGFL